MTPDDDFPIHDDVVVAPGLRHRLNQLIRSVTRIVISRKDEDGKAPVKVNGLKLSNTPGGLPKETLDEIAEATAAIMHGDWLTQETEDPDIGLPPVEYVVSCEYYSQKPDGKKKRVRNQFTWVYKGGAEVPGSNAVEETWTMEERSIQRAMDVLERQVGQLQSHNDTLHTLFIRLLETQSNAMSALGGASAETMKHGLPMFFGGIQAMLNARAMEYNTAKADAEAKYGAEKWVKGLQAIGPFLGLGVSQLLANKLGVDPQTLASMFGMGGPMGGPMGGAPPTAAPTSTPPSEDGGPPTDLVAAFASELGASLDNAQRRDLARRFAPEQIAALDDLFCARTDQEALAAYATVVQIAGPKLVVLQELLTDDQRQLLHAFFQSIQHAQQQSQAQPPAP